MGVPNRCRGVLAAARGDVGHALDAIDEALVHLKCVSQPARFSIPVSSLADRPAPVGTF